MSESLDIDDKMMARALELAARGVYTSKPNPRVGAVITRGEQIVAESWHTQTGQPHAEINALTIAGEKARGADLYINLEPCAHQGLTGPCAPKLVTAGIRRVIIAMQDPNPDVAGRGIAILRKAGIQISLGTGAKEAQELNKGFVTRMLTGQPFVRLKLAATIDGRTAAPDGSSQWITSKDARVDVHHWRAASSAVVTGIATILSDNPRLDARLDEDVVQPLRVVLDSKGRLSADASLFTVNSPVLIVVGGEKPPVLDKFDARTEQMHLPDESGRIDLQALLVELGKRGCNDILIEAGATLVGDFVARDLVDEYVLYLSPDILGSDSLGMFSISGITDLKDRISLEMMDIDRFGRDVRIRLRPEGRA